MLLYLFVTSFLSAEQWYRSDKGGLALQTITKTAAAREPYALMIEDLTPLPLMEAYELEIQGNVKAETQYLHENGTITLTRKVIHDANGQLRLVETEYSDGLYLLELYDEKGLLIQERRKSIDGILFLYEYQYNDDFKILEKKQYIPGEQNRLTATEHYLYDRQGALRRIDRYIPEESANLESAADTLLQKDPVASFSPEQQANFFSHDEDTAVQYLRDDRGRILAEQHYDENGALISEIVYTWQGDRLYQVVRREDQTELKTEYEYDSEGIRIRESNYRNGILERVQYQDGIHEIEELYLAGSLVLRATWKDGQKVLEEQFDD